MTETPVSWILKNGLYIPAESKASLPEKVMIRPRSASNMRFLEFDGENMLFEDGDYRRRINIAEVYSQAKDFRMAGEFGFYILGNYDLLIYEKMKNLGGLVFSLNCKHSLTTLSMVGEQFSTTINLISQKSPFYYPQIEGVSFDFNDDSGSEKIVFDDEQGFTRRPQLKYHMEGIANYVLSDRRIRDIYFEQVGRAVMKDSRGDGLSDSKLISTILGRVVDKIGPPFVGV